MTLRDLSDLSEAELTGDNQPLLHMRRVDGRWTPVEPQFSRYRAEFANRPILIALAALEMPRRVREAIVAGTIADLDAEAARLRAQLVSVPSA